MSATDLFAPCGWDVMPPECCAAWERASEAERERAERMAVFVLWALTGRQFGRCPVTIRPCRKQCAPNTGGWAGSSWVPVRSDGAWTNVRCGCASHPCSCTSICEVQLPGWLPEPVRVHIDGEELSPDAYRVDNGRWLVRQDGDCWPNCQDLSLPDGEPGTWSVTLLTGMPVPPEGQWAAGQLACELVKACDSGPGGECRLPSGIQELHRQGVDIVFQDVQRVTNGGRLTGLPEVDLWIRAVNPHGVTRRAAVYSPELNLGRVQTWP